MANGCVQIDDKYVLIYSRWSADGEWELPGTNYTLAYAYADEPLGPFTYGGTLIDARGRRRMADGTVRPTASPTGNTHGSLVKTGDQWWLVYHRQTGHDEYSRQAMVAPMHIEVEHGRGGHVWIDEGEYTSEGFRTQGLDPRAGIQAGWACYYTAPEVVYSNTYGPYVRPSRNREDKNPCPVVNIGDGCVVGWRYIDMRDVRANSRINVHLHASAKGTIRVLLDDPENGEEVATIPLRSGQKHASAKLRINANSTPEKRAVYMVFSFEQNKKNVCELYCWNIM